MAGRGAQNLVLRASALQSQLQALVVGLQGVCVVFESVELGFEVTYMAFLALPKGALSASGSVTWRLRWGRRHTPPYSVPSAYSVQA